MSQPFFIALLASTAVGVLFYGAWAMRQEGSRKGAMKDRLRGASASVAVEQGKPLGQAILRELKFSEIPFLNALLSGAAFAGFLRLWLLQARVKSSPGVLLLTSSLLALLGFFGAWLPTERPSAAVVAALVFGGIPWIIVARKRKKRFHAFARQLPDGLTMMKNSLQAGHTLDKAMQVISEEMPDPIALEFKETVEELHLGVPVKRAMENFNSRIIDENLKIFVAALLVQREVGGNLNELLGNLAGTIRERFRLDQEVISLTAEGRISGYVIGALPIALAIIINGMQPDYLKPLYTTETGVALLKVALVLETIGFYCIRRVCRVNF
jgi:tight adherence protein B